MNLDNFIINIQQQLSDFRENWITAHSADPEANPLKLWTEHQWFSIFLRWKEAQDDGV